MKKFNFKSFSRRQSIEKYNKPTIYPQNSLNTINSTNSISVRKTHYSLDKKYNINKINLLTTLEKILAPENKELLNNLIEIKKHNIEHQINEENKYSHLVELEKCKMNSEIFISTIASLEVAHKVCSIFSFNVIKELEINLTPQC
jgi:hypothetical protein